MKTEKEIIELIDHLIHAREAAEKKMTAKGISDNERVQQQFKYERIGKQIKTLKWVLEE